jgi:hypothetical protein
MKKTLLSIAVMLALAGACFAQQWEIGGTGGAGFLKGLPVTSPLGAATAGFQTGMVAGGFIGHLSSNHLGGELHYNFLQSNLKLTSGGTEATFSGQAHVVDYELILHTGSKRGSRIQAFVALGGGMKMFRGTGKEAAYQPLSQFAYLTKTQSVKPMAAVGGGLKFSITRNVWLRTEFRDYITPFPKEVITPAPGAKISGILHDFVPMVGISFEF